MQNQARILFVVPFANPDARAFVDLLANGMKDWNIPIKDSGLTTLLFEAGKFDLIHFFLPAGSSPLRLPWKDSKKVLIQTMLTLPQNPEEYRKGIFADCVITFSEKQCEAIHGVHNEVKTEVILPCAPRPAIETLEPPSIVRDRYDVKDRLLALSLSDFNTQEQFATFLYTAREYQRREGFRFVIPLFHKDRQSMVWREHLQNAITQEKLTATTLLNETVDVHSLIDAADVALYMDKKTAWGFGFPILAVETLCSGKPVISYESTPVGEFMNGFDPSWVAKAYEDFSRISRDLIKQSHNLEQISTDLARFALTQMSVDVVAGKYGDLYKGLLKL